MKKSFLTTIAALSILAATAVEGTSFGESISVRDDKDNFTIHLNCKSIKTSYNYAEIYRANKAAHPEWSEKRLQLATERTLSLLIAAMEICDGKTQFHKKMVSGGY